MSHNYIIAGNNQQAADYAKARGWGSGDYRYVAGVEGLRGVRDARIHICGTWWRRADERDIAQELVVIMYKSNVEMII